MVFQYDTPFHSHAILYHVMNCADFNAYLFVTMDGQLVIPQTGETFSSLYEKLLAGSLELSQQFVMNDCACTHIKIE